jgi:NAD(P)H-dependent flavin oxidoreductase YrpB (nitropropane dioxygenase family)
MSNKQTAVQWLQECLSLHLTHEQQMQFEGLFQQANDMARHQVMEGHIIGLINEVKKDVITQAKEYYNETYEQ